MKSAPKSIAFALWGLALVLAILGIVREGSAPNIPLQSPSVAATTPGSTRPWLEVADLAALLPGLGISASKQRPGWYQFRTWREPELRIGRTDFQLAMNWNGLDDQNWPFTRILDALVSKACGNVRHGWSEAFIDRLYKTRTSPESGAKDAEGREIYSLRLAEMTGSCRVELTSRGARWNDLVATVNRSN